MEVALVLQLALKLADHPVELGMRSGRFQQTRNVLHDELGYCCLGVACETYRRLADLDAADFGKNWEQDEMSGVYYFQAESELLPDLVTDWLELEEDPILLVNGKEEACSVLNDTRKLNFAAIADAIERTYLNASPVPADAS